jgi:cell division septum initiation protein DivIVA
VTDYDPDVDLDLDLTPPPVGAQYHPAETEDVLLQLRDIIEAARPVPLSASSMIAKDEVLELIDEALAQLPEELRAARWLLKEREEFLARTRHDADEIIAQARARAERMVQRTEVVKAAEQRSYEIVDAAETEARRLHHEVEDFCDQKLASFEIVLERTQKLVAAGRAKLQGANLLAEAAAAAEHGVVGPSGEDPDPDAGATVHALADVDPGDPGDAGDEQGYTADDGYRDEPALSRRAEQRRIADLPPPPVAATAVPGGDAEATFFDQDLA